MQRIVAIVGATATGKTAVGDGVADAIGGEVVCADSRQLYRELEIGTGKPTPAERERRPHHLFDALGLGERASAGSWARLARTACREILERGATPVLVGGSGLYLRALVIGLNAEPPHDPEIRDRLGAELASSGPEALRARLAAVDAPTAARLAPRDGQRILRALEVYESSGRPLSWWHAHAPREALPGDWRVLELQCPPPLLAERIEGRTRAMFDRGLPAEARALLERGLRDPLARLRAIGYDEAVDFLDGRITRDEAEARTNARTRGLAKRQRTWFRHQSSAVPLAAGGAAAGRLVDEAMVALRLA